MNRPDPPSFFGPGPNPYEAPRSPLGYPAAPGVAGGPVLSVTHDLTDRDLRRFVDYDYWFDPKPVAGLIPQGALLIPVTFAVGVMAGLVTTRSVVIGVVGGVVVAATCCLSLALSAAARRRLAVALGCCRGRTVAVGPGGLGVTIEGVSLPPPAFPFLSDRCVGPLALPWSAVRDIEHRGEYLFFWLNKGRARLVVPRRAFADEAAVAAFVQAARRYRQAAD